MVNCWRCVAVVFGVVAAVASNELADEAFEEDLFVKPLPDGKVLSKFTFKTLLKGATPRRPSQPEDSAQHYTLFPLALGRVIREYAVDELHLSLNAGHWQYERWGMPEEPNVGTGAELWAWLAEEDPTTLDARWSGVRNALAGLFCATLGTMDEWRTTSPALTYPPEGGLPAWNVTHHLRHATLPSEHVCTENLTPFRKLLPCKSRSGIASLLDPHHLFDGDWHGLGVHVRWIPEEGIEVRLTAQVVSDLFRTLNTDKRDWSFQTLFGRTIEKACPVAGRSTVRVTLPIHEPYQIHPEPTLVKDNLAIYEVAQGPVPLDVDMKWPMPQNWRASNNASHPLSIRRALRGFSQERGQLSIVIKNELPSEVRLRYLETLPWFVQMYLHTMRIESNGVLQDDLLSDISYIPTIPHSRPTTFQATLALPASSTTEITFDVTKAFLRYTEHLPDAQRGWDLPPAVFVPLDADPGVLPPTRIYTPILLVDLATPDFSMPYNVIILSCSLIAFLFGSTFNLLTRKFVVIRLDQARR
ncbi:Gpi16 subunit, GPI transamidase component [Schizophyllum commune H4-8]|uniref:GPI transamidase component PIG-T n=1 Tax=Schizophyllum commune (strain H4-8 / FGSC 9210) TaxID=578458 RepID=D8PYV1_SCHCM|nr:Gpi16 subunit, GPI transamidase component [Schizophyllum commune H4-8]KAI5896118.1 Gpi16 subunit, GPI transamidase component [Schizophyllum commune H4-8]